jgi:hypothetical protein
MKTDDYCSRYSYGDDAKIRSDLDHLVVKLKDAICYNDLEEVGSLARKMSYTAQNISKLNYHNEMVERARKAVLEVPKGGYVTRYSVRQLFYDTCGGYYEFAYGATIVALEELVADEKLQVVRTYGNEIAYKRI